jgi:hypothetical protein
MKNNVSNTIIHMPYEYPLYFIDIVIPNLLNITYTLIFYLLISISNRTIKFMFNISYSKTKYILILIV